MTERAVILMPFIRSGFDTDVFHAILIRVKIKIFYQENIVLTKFCGVVFWSKLNTRRIVSSALNMGYMLPKFHGHIQVVDLPRISTLPLHGLHTPFVVHVLHLIS